jgi:hypothetical protein
MGVVDVSPVLRPAAAGEPGACDPSAALFAMGDDLVAPPVPLDEAFVHRNNRKYLEHNPDLITSLVADEATTGVVMSGRSGLDSSKRKLLEGLVPLARHLREPLDEIILGEAVLPSSPADFGKLIASDTEKWAKVIRAANIKP